MLGAGRSSPSPVRRKKGDDFGEGAPRVLPSARPLPGAGRVLPALPRSLPVTGSAGRSYSLPAQDVANVPMPSASTGAAGKTAAAGGAAPGAGAPPPAAGLGAVRASSMRPSSTAAAAQPLQHGSQAAQSMDLVGSSPESGQNSGSSAATAAMQGSLSARQGALRRPLPAPLHRATSTASAASASSTASGPVAAVPDRQLATGQTRLRGSPAAGSIHCTC